MQEGCAMGGNVFLAPHWRQIDPDLDPDGNPPVVTRTQRRKKS